MIRKVKTSDAGDICRIYNHYILNTRITFEETPLRVKDMVSRIRETTKRYPWLVCEQGGKVIGYTHATRWKDRSAYRYSAEAGIYLDPGYTGQGIGSALAERLIGELGKKSFHSIICGIALPNRASIALCEKFGFTKVARFREVGYKFGQWIDVGYWEFMLKPPPRRRYHPPVQR